MYKCIISCPVNQKPHIPFSSSHRYQLSSPSSNGNLSPYTVLDDRLFFEVNVIDTQPGEQSTLDSNLDQVHDFDKQSLMAAGIPHLAFTYLALADYHPTVPELLDAWIDDQQQEIVIINPDNDSSSLKDYLIHNQVESSKIVAFLQTMTKLWKNFRKINCCNTLLNLDNLKVSQDGSFSIEKLYLDKEPIELKQLVNTWTNLLGDITRDYQSLISNLMNKIELGDINNVKQLRKALQIIAQEIELQSVIEEKEKEAEIDLDLLSQTDELHTLVENLDYDDNLDSSEATYINNINQDIDDQPTVVLPMKLLAINEAGLTDIGKRRGHNEDYFAIDTKIHKQETIKGTNLDAKGLYIVCDGMGGHASGEVASAMAVQYLQKYFYEHWQDNLPNAEIINKGILLTNDLLYTQNTKKGETGSGRMGTTLVMGLLHNNQLVIAHVGDSRAYKVTRKSGLEQLTTDHCVAQTEITQGVSPEIAFARPDALQLTQALGPRDNDFVHPEIYFIDLKEDTLLLLCSDGLYSNDLLENNYQKLLLPLISSSSNLEEGLAKIVDFANEINGHDNITGLLVRIKVQPNLENKSTLF